jgi:hypothetical protein
MARQTPFTKTFSNAAQAELQPGETVLAAARGLPKGAVARVAGATGGLAGAGAVGAIIGLKVTGKKAEEGAAQGATAGLDTLPPQLALGLTNRRLLVYRRSTVSGKMTDFFGEIPRERIRSIDSFEGSNPFKPHRLTVTLDDGGTIEFEIVRMDKASPLSEAFSAG